MNFWTLAGAAFVGGMLVVLALSAVGAVLLLIARAGTRSRERAERLASVRAALRRTEGRSHFPCAGCQSCWTDEGPGPTEADLRRAEDEQRARLAAPPTHPFGWPVTLSADGATWLAQAPGWWTSAPGTPRMHRRDPVSCAWVPA